MSGHLAAASLENDNIYQISDVDLDDCDDDDDDTLLEEVFEPHPSNSNSISQHRGPYERAWTTEATRALIHVRGPMENRFCEGRHKRTALWLQCTRQLQKMGFRYNAAKVQKKWHNILITYNKNLSKKYATGYVHWEFFEDMFKYLQGKKADFEIQQRKSNSMQEGKVEEIADNQYMKIVHEPMIQAHVEIDSKSNDDFDEDDSGDTREIKKPKLELKQEKFDDEDPIQISVSSSSGGYDQQNSSKYNSLEPQFTETYETRARPPLTAPSYEIKELIKPAPDNWWQDYFERKIQVERDKIDLQKQMHRDLMQFNKMSLIQQEKIERIKIDAINSLTSTLQKLVETKYKKT
uniref:Myb/SANT-like DNA-binding domain-containing protein n=1 Tax=Glossina palpalis gambiensis TaxID=67801 RepID=A0A1B0ALK1_9MUSC